MTDRATPSDSERLRKQLAGHPFVNGLTEGDIDILTAMGSIVEFAPNETLFRTGDTAQSFYLVRSGVVALTVDAGDAVPRTIELISEGSALGWSWLFEPYRWQFDAVAKTPVRAIVFDTPSLRARCEEDPAFGFRLLLRVADVIGKRLLATRLQVVNLSR